MSSGWNNFTYIEMIMLRSVENLKMNGTVNNYVTCQRIHKCNTSSESFYNCLKPIRELFSISILQFAQMPNIDISFSRKNNEIFVVLSAIIFFFKYLGCISVSASAHARFHGDPTNIDQTYLHEVGKTCFLVIPCIGQRNYSVSAATGCIG